MQQNNAQLVLAKNDYETIMTNINHGLGDNTFNREDVNELKAELKKAQLVESEEVPDDVVRLNSEVTIKDEKADKVMHVTVVTPEQADIKKRKISIMSPIGTALIGYRKGKKVSWKVPAGQKTFTILDVNYQGA